MPFYRNLTSIHNDESKRGVDRLLDLRKQLKKEIPPRDLERTLLLATWNIREFDSPKFGGRAAESYYYIAEILSHFDLIALQEVYRDLEALQQVQRILGPDWKFIFTDETMGSAGNKERLAFLYDTRKVTFGGLASEIVIPDQFIKGEGGKREIKPSRQLSRTPLAVGFKSGWTNFVLTTVHIYYGDAKAEDPTRVEEINAVAKFLSNQSEDPTAWSRNFILLGDFNIFSTSDSTMKALTANGFSVPKELQQLPSNIARDKFYDQIAFKVRDDRFETAGQAGIFNFFDVVFRDEDEETYIPLMGDAYYKNAKGEERKDPSTYYKQWRTFQMSDHLPMWVQIRIDFSDAYLGRKLLQMQAADADAASRSLQIDPTPIPKSPLLP
jgi:endonuclease/exonuclease/phosphatase family metal-dependent hydrolase